MNDKQTSIIYEVNSDLDSELLFAEFETKEAAIAYAKRNIDRLPFVDEVEVTFDDQGEVDDIISRQTIWAHNNEVYPTNEDEDEDYWDMLCAEYEDQENGRHAMSGTFNGINADELVETLEENETDVECKECFDLFPKDQCVKVAFGYICPTCAKCEVADEDMFKVDFPEYEKFSSENEMIPSEPDPEPMPDISPNPDPMPEAEETENDLISEPEEAIPFLVKDEEEAIAGYEAAEEVVADSDLENKEEILDTIDHIKEEEEEHIEELNDLVDTDEDPVFEDEEDENGPISTPEEEETEPLTENAQRAGGFRTDGYRTAYACYDSDDFDINVELGMQDEDDYEVENQLYLLGPGQTVADLVVYLSRECGFTNVYVHTETSANRDEIKTASKFTTVPGNHDYRHYGTIQDRLVEHIQDCPEPIESDQELEGTDNAVVKCKVADVVTHSEDEKPVDCEGKKKPFMEGYQKFTPEEMEEYGIDEDGNSIEGYDEYVRCTWCEEIFTKDMCGFEADLGWLCDRCQQAITSRGERLTMVINPTEDDFKRVMNEDIPMTSDELMNKYGTDDVDLINAGKESEERVALQEKAPEYDLTEVNKLLAEIGGKNKKKSIHMR